MKMLSLALLVVVSLNVANAQSSHGTSNVTAFTTLLPSISTTGYDGKVQYQQIVEDAGVFLATHKMTPELAEVVKALREEDAALTEVSDKELVKRVLRQLNR